MILKSHVNAKQKILLLTYAKFAYMQNLRICKSLPCVQGFRGRIALSKYVHLLISTRSKIKARKDKFQDLINAPSIFSLVLIIESPCI